MDPAVLGWLDPDNNQAFLTEQISATVNVNTIYLGARDAADQKGDVDKKRIAEAMDHANWPAGPAGRFANYNINLWAAFADSPNPDGARAFLRAFFDKKFLVPWTKTGRSYLTRSTGCLATPGRPAPRPPMPSTSSCWWICSPARRQAR